MYRFRVFICWVFSRMQTSWMDISYILYKQIRSKLHSDSMFYVLIWWNWDFAHKSSMIFARCVGFSIAARPICQKHFKASSWRGINHLKTARVINGGEALTSLATNDRAMGRHSHLKNWPSNLCLGKNTPRSWALIACRPFI